jgi:hypothetical protein
MVPDQTVAPARQPLGATAPTSARERQEFGGPKTVPAQRIQDREREHARRHRLLADAARDQAILVGGGGADPRHDICPDFGRQHAPTRHYFSEVIRK